MARRASTLGFERVINLAIAKVKPPEIQKLHAQVAREVLAEHLAGLHGAKPHVRRIVDGREGASEDSVRPYGRIRYEFEFLRDAVLFALEELQERSPERSGTYRQSWFLLYRGKQIEPAALPADADDVTITNDQPYSRMLVVGRRADGRPFSLQNPPPGFLELVRMAVRSRFGNSVNVITPFIQLEGGYRLKGDYLQPGRYTAARRDRAGEPITYPSLRIYRR